MKRVFVLSICFILIICGSVFIFKKESNSLIDKPIVKEVNNNINIELDLEYPKLYPLYFNNNFGYHNTSERTSKIEYIVIHYTGEEKDAKDFVDFFNDPTSVYASADYFVGFNGDIYKYNLEVEKRYSWAVGGNIITDKPTNGGAYQGIVTNDNSISIEMSAYSGGSIEANEPGWSLSEDTIDSTVYLTRYLMEVYNIPVENVVRHYDVTGKWCPGVIGWNDNTINSNKWVEFKDRLV